MDELDLELLELGRQLVATVSESLYIADAENLAAMFEHFAVGTHALFAIWTRLDPVETANAPMLNAVSNGLNMGLTQLRDVCGFTAQEWAADPAQAIVMHRERIEAAIKAGAEVPSNAGGAPGPTVQQIVDDLLAKMKR